MLLTLKTTLIGTLGLLENVNTLRISGMIALSESKFSDSRCGRFITHKTAVGLTLRFLHNFQAASVFLVVDLGGYEMSKFTPYFYC